MSGDERSHKLVIHTILRKGSDAKVHFVLDKGPQNRLHLLPWHANRSPTWLVNGWFSLTNSATNSFRYIIIGVNTTNLFIAQLRRVQVSNDFGFRSRCLGFRTCLQNVVHVFLCFGRKGASGNRGEAIPAKPMDWSACNSHAIRNGEHCVSKRLLNSSQKHRANCGECFNEKARPAVLSSYRQLRFYCTLSSR